MATLLVTGGFGALGAAVVAHMLRHGQHVTAIDRAPVPAQAPASLNLGGVDLADSASVIAAFARAAAAADGVAGLVAIAGGFLFQPMASAGARDWDGMYATNLKSCALSCAAALPFLPDGGAIVTVGAGAAARPGAGMAPYAAAKAGVMAVTMSLAEELRGRRIRVNAILPTILDTAQNRADMPESDRRDWITPEAAAKVIAFLLSPDAAAITGAGIPLNAGF